MSAPAALACAVALAVACCVAAPVRRAHASPGATRPSATRPAASAPTAAQVAEMERLVSLLSSRDWKVRGKAEVELAKLGDVAEGRLRKLAAATDDPEVRARAHSALERIAGMRKLGPTRVKLSVKDATPQEVFAELGRQGGVPIEAFRPSLWRQRDWPKMTLDLPDEPFWSAVRQACLKSGLRPLYDGGDGAPGRVVLFADVVGDMAAPVAFSSSFMVSVNSLTKVSDFLADEGPQGEAVGKGAGGGAAAQKPGESLELQLTFYADPKWRIVDHPEEAAIASVADDKGNALPVPAPMRLQAFKDSPIWQMRTIIRGVPPGCPRLTGLKGSFRIVLLEQSEPAEVADVMNARNVSRRAGKQSVTLREVTKENDEHLYRVKLLIARNGLSAREWRQGREMDGVSLLDGRGRAMTRVGFDAQEDADQVAYDVQFVPAAGEEDAPAGREDAKRAPAKLVCRVPLEPREVTVPFEFGAMPVER